MTPWLLIQYNKLRRKKNNLKLLYLQWHKNPCIQAYLLLGPPHLTTHYCISMHYNKEISKSIPFKGQPFTTCNAKTAFHHHHLFQKWWRLPPNPFYYSSTDPNLSSTYHHFPHPTPHFNYLPIEFLLCTAGSGNCNCN